MISKKNVTRFVETLRVNEEYEEPVALHLVSSRKAWTKFQHTYNTLAPEINDNCYNDFTVFVYSSSSFPPVC